jgi:hypothetical protein
MRRKIAWATIILSIIAMLVMAFISASSEEEATPAADTPTAAVTPTEEVQPTSPATEAGVSPTAPPVATTPPPTSLPPTPAGPADSDGDLFPDEVEQGMGTDPTTNECAEAAGPPVMNLLVLLDSSAAMSGTLPGGDKLPLVDNALQQYIDSAGVGVNAGLLTYGGGCVAPRLAVPLGPASSKAFAAATAGLSPQGETPLGAALTSTAKSFAQLEGQSNRILLLAAGGDNCGQNACQTAAALEKSSASITVDVMGIGVEDATRQELECIANSSGGLYYDAPTANDLHKVWGIQNRKMQEEVSATSGSQERVSRYRDCLEDKLDRFRTWAESSGWKENNPDEYQRIEDEVNEEITRLE